MINFGSAGPCHPAVVEGARGFAATKPAPFGLRMSLCPLGGGCWGAPRYGSAPVAPGRCRSQPGPAVCRDVPHPVLALRLPEPVSLQEPVPGEGAGSLQHPTGKGALKSAPAPERGSRGAAVPRPRRGCPGPCGSWDCGQQWTAAWAGAASLSPSHPHPRPWETRAARGCSGTTGARSGDVYHIYLKPSVQSQSRAQQLLTSPRELGSALCVCPHASLCV